MSMDKKYAMTWSQRSAAYFAQISKSVTLLIILVFELQTGSS